MQLSKYIDQMFTVTGSDEMQLEVRIDQNGNVNELSPNIVRFNVKRTTQSHGEVNLDFKSVAPEMIAKEVEHENVPRRYRDLPKSKPNLVLNRRDKK